MRIHTSETWIYLYYTRSAVSRDSRHFESPLPPPQASTFSLSARAVGYIYNTHTDFPVGSRVFMQQLLMCAVV